MFRGPGQGHLKAASVYPACHDREIGDPDEHVTIGRYSVEVGWSMIVGEDLDLQTPQAGECRHDLPQVLRVVIVHGVHFINKAREVSRIKWISPRVGTLNP
jgi:hypothetical protein